MVQSISFVMSYFILSLSLHSIKLMRLLLLFPGNQACKGNRVFQVPRIGVADDKVAQYASLHYYNDKELQVIFNVNTDCIMQSQTKLRLQLACIVTICNFRSRYLPGYLYHIVHTCWLLYTDICPELVQFFLHRAHCLAVRMYRVGTYRYCS